MLRLSQRSDIPSALSVEVNQRVYDLKREGKDVITLSLGEAFFDIPIFPFDWSRGYHYSDSQGLPELRSKIANYYKRYNRAVDPGNILISAGSKPIIFMAMQAVLDPGDTVVIHEPAWLSYQEQARLCGANVRFIPHDAPISDFEKYLHKAKLFIINNPNNPAGRVYSNSELLAIYEECRINGIWLLVDEAYSDFVSNDSFISLATLSGVIVVNSLSKNMGMSGWRVGYAISPHERIGYNPFIRRLLHINQHVITCAPTVLQQYLAEYFDQILQCTLPQVRAVVEKRKRIADTLDRLGIKYLPGSATFYFFLDLSHHHCTGAQLAEWLLGSQHIALVPGSAYGASTEKFLRMSIGTEPERRIRKALKTMGKVWHVRAA